MNLVHTPSMMFAERAEHVYFLAAQNAPIFVERLGAHLGIHCFHPGDPDAVEPPAHYVTTLYFDSDTHTIIRACESGSDGVKLRAREYYDHDPKYGIRREPLVWLEVKARAGSSTRKARFAVPSPEFHQFLHGGSITELIMVQRARWGRSGEAVIREIAELYTSAGSLEPNCLAHYRRRAWQDANATLRVTLDTELGFHRPPANLFHDGTTLIDAVAGPPLAQLGCNLVEIKLQRDPPAWLGQLIVDAGLEPALDGRRAFSKFLAASHAVHSAKIL